MIGDELLIGQVTDTNSGFIARTIAPEGWTVEGVETVGDNPEAIEEAVRRGFSQAEVVLTTGGLGPTKDDITKGVLMKIFGGELVRDEAVSANVEAVMSARGLKVNRLTADQALVPSSCTVIQNRLGTAPLMWFEDNRGVLVAMPGVPAETEGMFAAEVWPMLRHRFGQGESLTHSSFIVTGISESALAERLSGWEESLPGNFHLAYLPNAGYIRLRLDSIGAEGTEVETMRAGLKGLLGDNLVAEGDTTPARILLDAASELGMTLGSGESCTGGNITGALTAVPGASAVVKGGVVAYSNEVKTGVLGVPESLIASHGAVSEPVAAAMAEGVCRVLGSDVAMATSGVAGPGGGSPEKPVGTVCIAVAVRGKCVAAVTRHFPGDRSGVVVRAVNAALLLANDVVTGRRK